MHGWRPQKPRGGPIFVQRNEDKRNYRNLIRCRKNKEKQNISNDLLSSLCNNNTNTFWKTWKGKVCKDEKVFQKLKGQILLSQPQSNSNCILKK